MNQESTSPMAMRPAADVADAVLVWAENAAVRFLEHDRGDSARDVLQRVALGRALLRFSFSGSVRRCVLALRVVEAGSGRTVRVPLPYSDDRAAELAPVFLALLRMLRLANDEGRGVLPRRLQALLRSAEDGSGGIVFRVDFRGGFAYFEAADSAGCVWMRALCQRVGPGNAARPVVH